VQAGAELLRTVWTGSFVLAAASILFLLMLVIRRLIIQVFERRSAALRDTLRGLVLEYAATPQTPEPPQTLRRSADQRVLLSIVTEMMDGVAGDMRARLIGLLNAVIDRRRLLRDLRKGGPADRAKVAARLFWSNAPEVRDALRAALDDPEPDVVLAAVNSLLATGHPIDLITLVPKLERRDMLGHREVRDIFRKVAPQNRAALFALLDAPNPALVVLVIDALTRAPSDAALKRLRGMAQTHSSVDVRATALRTLGLAGDPLANSIIVGALNDPAWEVRTQAAIAAGRARIGEALPALTRLLDDANWWVQLRAAQALAQLGDAGLEVLENLLTDSEKRPLAAFALSERHAA
jgi:HEAT repeat protein